MDFDNDRDVYIQFLLESLGHVRGLLSEGDKIMETLVVIFFLFLSIHDAFVLGDLVTGYLVVTFLLSGIIIANTEFAYKLEKWARRKPPKMPKMDSIASKRSTSRLTEDSIFWTGTKPFSEVDNVIDINKLKAKTRAKHVLDNGEEEMLKTEHRARQHLKDFVIKGIHSIWMAAEAGRSEYEIPCFELTSGHGLNMDYAEAITIDPKVLSRMPKILVPGSTAWYLAQWCEKQNLQWELGTKYFDNGYIEGWTMIISWRD